MDERGPYGKRKSARWLRRKGNQETNGELQERQDAQRGLPPVQTSQTSQCQEEG